MAGARSLRTRRSRRQCRARARALAANRRALRTLHPRRAQTYTTAITADVLATAGNAALTVTDASPTAPGRLVNGSNALVKPLLAAARRCPRP